MFEKGQKLRHISSGEIVEFVEVNRKHRGVTKILTTGPWGPLNVDQFEIPEPEWPLKTEPQAYLDRYGEDAEYADLARKVLEVRP